MKVQTPLPHSDQVVVVSQRTDASPEAEVEALGDGEGEGAEEEAGGEVVVAAGAA
jgi:hypothetical protein